MAAIQSSIGGHFSGNNNSNNITTNNYGVQVPSYVPGMQPLIAHLYFKLMAKNFGSNLRRADGVHGLGGVATGN